MISDFFFRKAKARLKTWLFTVFLLFLFLPDFSDIYAVPSAVLSYMQLTGNRQTEKNIALDYGKIESEIQRLLSLPGKQTGLKSLADSLIRISAAEQDSMVKADFYYYAALCEYFLQDYHDALKWFTSSVKIKETLRETDNHYAKALYDIAVSHWYLADYQETILFSRKYIDVGSDLFGENSNEVASAYTVLLGAEIQSNEYKKFTEDTFRALGIIGQNKLAMPAIDLGRLYETIGVGYIRMDDYSKARIYLEEAEKIYNSQNVKSGVYYINLINSLAATYGYLGMPEKESEYFTKGIELAVKDNSFAAFNLINSYVLGLSAKNKISKGAELLSSLVDKARAAYGIDSRYYFEVLWDYAEYILLYSDNKSDALNLFAQCYNYINDHRDDAFLRSRVLSGYADALVKSGQYKEALVKIQEYLFSGTESFIGENLYINPPLDSLKPDKQSLSILRNKYNVLQSLYLKSMDLKILVNAAQTTELTIELLEKMRLNVSEEESRLIMGDKYRESYINAIRDFQQCYMKTGQKKYLEKAFEYSEKSKVAGLLAATRELNAIQFHIPPKIAELERSLQREISVFNSEISIENEKDTPDQAYLSEMKERLLATVSKRDSLALTFERDYPEYYVLKYNTKVPGIGEVRSIIGRNSNYLNYVVSDSILFIFLVNRKYAELKVSEIDTSFKADLLRFRKLLTDGSPSVNARDKYITYQDLAVRLYRRLIEPISKYFISDNILISPDNLLSYLPFETLIKKKQSGNDILYRNLDYLMHDYNISYTYSATFMKELNHKDNAVSNKLVAFAPSYTREILTDSLFEQRNIDNGFLYDLPYARQEAEYVSDLTHGKYYLNDDARESVYKQVAGNYDIIHLAMHTYMDDINPMNSALIFTLSRDHPDDGLLYTHEVYGIPLKAKMVVLSSCNTGSGKLSNGEGILSLARGFMYSGARSVVMSLWEIDDKSGTEIIKMFYDFLREGNSKSKALKKASIKYLKSASQLKSHPYYWATMVVYGDNSPVFTSGKILKLSIAVVILAGLLFIFYLLYRRNS